LTGAPPTQAVGGGLGSGAAARRQAQRRQSGEEQGVGAGFRHGRHVGGAGVLGADLRPRRLKTRSGCFIGTGSRAKSAIVLSGVCHCQVSGKQVLVQWFSHRNKHRDRPMIGDRRKPSPLGDIQPDRWLPGHTTEQLERICSGPLSRSPPCARKAPFSPRAMRPPATAPAQHSLDLDP
jgi:hypothetical protein